MRRSRLTVVGSLVALIIAAHVLGLGDILNLHYLKARQLEFAAFEHAHPVLSSMAFCGLYVVLTSMSLPVAGVLSVLAGALFGIWQGALLAAISATTGATMAFLLSRYLFRDWVASRFPGWHRTVERGMARDGAYYLFALRLVPAVPFFLLNLVMGLTRLSTQTYVLVSLLGMLPALLIFVYAGTQLASIETMDDIIRPRILTALAMVGVLPLALRWSVTRWQRMRVLRRFPRPHRFDYNLAIVGGGAAGLTAAGIAAALNAKVLLVEQSRMGGECLNTGCVPTKALLRQARLRAELARTASSRSELERIVPGFTTVMQRVQETIQQLAPRDSMERFRALGVECIEGHARLLSPYCLQINHTSVTARNIILASGSRPAIPAIDGLNNVHYYTSETIWELRRPPQHLVIVGGGSTGCELAQAFVRLGVEVTLLERESRLLPCEDPEVSQLLAARLRAEGVTIYCDVKCSRIEPGGSRHALLIRVSGAEQECALAFSELLIATGRVPNTIGLDLAALGVSLATDGSPEVDANLMTSIPGVYACGDLLGPLRYTHVASYQASVACINALLGPFRRERVDYRFIPLTVYTDPEIARVGLNECAARLRGIPYEVTTLPWAASDRAVIDHAGDGFAKILTVPASDRLLGITLAGAHAGELLGEFALAMRAGIGLRKLLRFTHAYPGYGDILTRAAARWRQQHASPLALRWLAWYHGWRRGELRGRP